MLHVNRNLERSETLHLGKDRLRDGIAIPSAKLRFSKGCGGISHTY